MEATRAWERRDPRAAGLTAQLTRGRKLLGQLLGKLLVLAEADYGIGGVTVNVDPPETAEAAAPHVASSKRCSLGFSKIDILRRQKLLHLKGQLDKASNYQSHRFDIIQKCRLGFFKIPFA